MNLWPEVLVFQLKKQLQRKKWNNIKGERERKKHNFYQQFLFETYNLLLKMLGKLYLLQQYHQNITTRLNANN